MTLGKLSQIKILNIVKSNLLLVYILMKLVYILKNNFTCPRSSEIRSI